MYFKIKRIKGKKYKYAVKTIRMPNGKVISLEKIYKENSKELSKFFEKKEKEKYVKYMLSNIRTDHIFTKEQVEKIEEIKLNYKKILRQLNKSNIKDILDRFTANFTYESNALEGNSLTLKDVAIVMFENASIKGKDLREIYETRNSREVVELIMKNKFDINHKDIIRIHKILVKDVGINTGYKRIPNFIQGRENLKTSLPENVYQNMDNLIKWYHDNKSKIHPIKLAALFHGKFEQIHPFEDGNGRVGRFLINVILIKNKYPPLIIRKSQRISYLGALTKFDAKYTDNLERFILERFKETYSKFFEIYVKYLKD
ncbi:Fic family protein [Candidatus Pacearchaeota archaeon]|nr:Fic family protein [Candidatus Pacearchaeota archaeon]